MAEKEKPPMPMPCQVVGEAQSKRVKVYTHRKEKAQAYKGKAEERLVGERPRWCVGRR